MCVCVRACVQEYRVVRVRASQRVSGEGSGEVGHARELCGVIPKL